jgi:hypothetical protein
MPQGANTRGSWSTSSRALAASGKRLSIPSAPRKRIEHLRIMHGRTLGITAMQALRFVYVVNGRPSVDSTLMRALCLSYPDCEEFAPLKTTPVMATFRAKRRGHEPVSPPRRAPFSRAGIGRKQIGSQASQAASTSC